MPSERLHLRGLTEEIGGEIAKAVRLGLRDAAIRAHRVAVREATNNKPFPVADTGQLRRSFRWRSEGPDVYVVENEAPHAAFQEYGTRPGHRAPFEKLYAWARRKLRGYKWEQVDSETGEITKARLNRADRDGLAKAHARRVQAAIFKRGIKPKHFWARATVQFPDMVVKAVTRRLRKVR